MNEEEAMSVVSVIGELWPNPPVTETYLTFYALALEVIPTPQEALRAVKALFLDEKYRPAPGQVIDACTGSGGAAVAAWVRVLAAANARSARKELPPLEPADLVPLRAIGYDLGSVPTDPKAAFQLDRVRGQYLTAFRDQQRRQLVDSQGRAELAVGREPDVGRVIDTSMAARRI